MFCEFWIDGIWIKFGESKDVFGTLKVETRVDALYIYFNQRPSPVEVVSQPLCNFVNEFVREAEGKK